MDGSVREPESGPVWDSEYPGGKVKGKKSEIAKRNGWPITSVSWVHLPRKVVVNRTPRELLCFCCFPCYAMNGSGDWIDGVVAGADGEMEVPALEVWSLRLGACPLAPVVRYYVICR